MRRLLVTLIVITAIIAISTIHSEAAIKRVASRYNMLNFYGGYAIPHGEYDEVGLALFAPYNLDADSAFNASYFLGVDYGTLYSKNILYTV